jgi:hypothetical protein
VDVSGQLSGSALFAREQESLNVRPRQRSWVAAVEERLLLPTYASKWAFASVAAHRTLALPLQLAGPVTRWVAYSAGRAVEIAGIGRIKLIAPFCAGAFGGISPQSQEPARTLSSPDRLGSVHADIVVAEVHRWMAPRFRRAGWIIVPDAVRWHGVLAELPPAEPCRSLAEDLRKMKKQGFSLEQTTAPEDWHFFHTRMVQPQALVRHGESAWLPSSDFLRALARAGTLHLVSRAGERVAGLCTVPHGDKLWLPLSGVLDGKQELLRQGAGFAGLALAFEWGKANGFLQVDVGRTAPFLHDGVQQFKRKWGLRPISDPLAHLLAFRANSDAARAAFAYRPVLVEDGSALSIYRGTAE